MRIHMRRFTRSTSAFSKKIENHVASIAIHNMHHSFCRVHQKLRIAPAMTAGVSAHFWSIAETVALIPKPTTRLGMWVSFTDH
jgi:hypothetical protein